jgi:hypothetical protein
MGSLPGLDGSAFSSLTQFSFNSGLANNYQLWLLSSTKQFKSVAVMGGRNDINPADAYPPNAVPCIFIYIYLKNVSKFI